MGKAVILHDTELWLDLKVNEPNSVIGQENVLLPGSRKDNCIKLYKARQDFSFRQIIILKY